MSDNRFAEKILSIPEFTITDIKRSEHDIRYYVEKTDKPKVCPHCGVCNPAVRVHGSRLQDVRDINYFYTGNSLLHNKVRTAHFPLAFSLAFSLAFLFSKR